MRLGYKFTIYETRCFHSRTGHQASRKGKKEWEWDQQAPRDDRILGFSGIGLWILIRKPYFNSKCVSNTW